jgi:hypothetical protein
MRRRLDVCSRDLADPGDRGEDDVELRREPVQLRVGEVEPGQPGEVSDLGPGQRRRHEPSLSPRGCGRESIPVALATRSRRDVYSRATSVAHDDRVNFLLRVVLPDRPGMLGAVATALGDVRADILSLDVVERDESGAAVDDLVVTLPPGRLPDVLVSACQQVPDVTVEFLRPYAGGAELHRDLDLVEVIASDPDRALELLVEHLPGVLRAGWTVLFTANADGTPMPIDATAAAPELLPITPAWCPLSAAVRLADIAGAVPPAWVDAGVEMAAAPVGRADLVVVAGRPGGPRFRPSELARLAHLAGIAATVGRQRMATCA